MNFPKHPVAGAALTCLIAGSGSLAADPMITGEQDLVCASQGVVACTAGPACIQGNASDFDLPVFMFVNVESKSIRAVGEDDETVTSPILTHEITDESLIMQGYENHRGWTMAVDRMGGEFTVSSTGPDVDFMITGACTTL